jgi:hypothetical protein
LSCQQDVGNAKIDASAEDVFERIEERLGAREGVSLASSMDEETLKCQSQVTTGKTNLGLGFEGEGRSQRVFHDNMSSVIYFR